MNAADTGTPVGYQAVRYLEDWGYLASKPALGLELEGWERLKYIPLWPGGYLSVGGQHRVRYELVDPVDLGVAPAGGARERGSALFSRNLVHLDLHVMPELRIFGQLGGFYALGIPSSEANPPDADDADVTQLFVEVKESIGPVGLVTRVGRQEMPLGSTRWVSTRDGTNVRQAFDLVRTTATVGQRFTVDAFLGTTPALKRGAFDDAPEWRDGFWGAYGTTRVLPAKLMSLDTFYLGRRRHEAKYEATAGREVRHTFGARLFGETSFGLEYIEHAMVQVGSIDASPILAWAFASALWQRLPGVLAPFRVGVRSDALSGDTHPGSGTLRTFYPLFPNQTFFSALPAIYPSNLYDVHPLLRFGVERLELEGGCVVFWRQAVEDAVYAPPGAVLVSGATNHARYTGAQASLSLAYKAERHLSFNAEYSHYFTGPALSAAGGTSVDFFGTWTTYTY